MALIFVQKRRKKMKKKGTIRYFGRGDKLCWVDFVQLKGERKSRISGFFIIFITLMTDTSS